MLPQTRAFGALLDPRSEADPVVWDDYLNGWAATSKVRDRPAAAAAAGCMEQASQRG